MTLVEQTGVRGGSDPDLGREFGWTGWGSCCQRLGEQRAVLMIGKLGPLNVDGVDGGADGSSVGLKEVEKRSLGRQGPNDAELDVEVDARIEWYALAVELVESDRPSWVRVWKDGESPGLVLCAITRPSRN